MELNHERCPLCGTELSGVKFKEIQTKLRLDEQQKTNAIAQAESAIKARLEHQFEQSLQKERQAFEKRMQQQTAAQISKLTVERDQAAARVKQAEAREAVIRKQVADEAAKARQTELANQRQSLETDKKLALIRQQSEFNREREALQGKLHLVEKRLQKKTANELGDGPEIDLLEELREFFPTDNVSRVPKGQPGADIRHEVLYKGVRCGLIIIDSKNRQSWQDSYVTKLRQDQSDAGAEHAVLATTVFPSGKKEMCIESDVIVISPARVVHIVQLLRNASITMHVRGLSMKERSTKMARLYELITSDSYTRKLTEAGKLTEEILDLDVQEKKAHDNVWKKRGILAKRAQNVLREAETELASVIESTEDTEAAPPPFSVKSAPSTTVASQAQGMS